MFKVESTTSVDRKKGTCSSRLGTEQRSTKELEVELLDVAAINLPFMDKLITPDSADDHTKMGKDVVLKCRCIHFCNYRIRMQLSCPVRNTLISLFHEWAHKPVGFVSYGGLGSRYKSCATVKAGISLPEKWYHW